jgi:hypothetical protein
MKIIYSHWQASNHKFCDKEMAKLSNQSVKKLGYKTCLYTDKIGYDLLSDIGYDEIVLFDELILSKFHKKVWSLGKILAMSLVREPFIHLDFDVFLFKKIEDKISKTDFFSLYFEPWLTKELKLHSKELLKLEKININHYLSWNFSVVGGQNFLKINEACEEIINLAILNKHNVNRTQFKKSWVLAVVFEQVLVPKILKEKYNIEVNTIFPDSPYDEELYEKEEYASLIKEYFINYFIQNKIVHLHGDKLNKFNVLKNYLT